MSDHPTISVVLPVRYVNEAWLRRSVESVLDQDYPAKELIVVNDEATRNIDALIASYGTIKYLRNDRNRKLPYSLNRGFREASGAWHTWTSADNYMRPGMLTRLAQVLAQDASVDIVFGRSLDVDEEGREVDRNPEVDVVLSARTGVAASEEVIPARFTYFTTLGACFLYRASVWRDLGGYDEFLHGGEDYDFWVRASRHHRIRRLPAGVPPLYGYRVHPHTISATVGGCYSRMRVGILLRRLMQGVEPALLKAISLYVSSWLSEGLRGWGRRLRTRLSGTGGVRPGAGAGS
jgi:GT2 family glycosyltransferase